MPGRSGTSSGGDYRYGFNGQEKDDEMKGAGNSINFEYRMHDTRLGRFLSIDPLSLKYPWYTPYQFAGNKPIWARELEGLEEWYTTTGSTEPDPAVTGGGPVRAQTGPLEPAVAADEYGYASYGIREQVQSLTPQIPDANISKILTNEYQKGQERVCFLVYREYAALAIGDNNVANISARGPNGESGFFTNSLIQKGYVSDPINIQWNYNNGSPIISGKISAIEQATAEDGNYFFAIRVAGSIHTMSLLVVTSNGIRTYSLMDQGTSWTYTSASRPAIVTSTDLTVIWGVISEVNLWARNRGYLYDPITHQRNGNQPESFNQMNTTIRQYYNLNITYETKFYPIE